MRKRWRRIGRLFRRFTAERRGATAIEFAILAFPFLAFCGALTETGLMYFTESVLDQSVSDAARLIKTGQAQNSSMSVDDFKSAVCDKMFDLFDCSNKIYVDSQVLASFADASTALPLDADGNLLTSTSFNVGSTSQIVEVRIFLPWTRLLGLLPVSGSVGANGTILLNATAIFRNEPF
ncbi:Flp pilus assembly protein TadG [Hartmannibacter diazotrophicus]|uniref:Flp pilus assembly protein TadG n=1 Tax=Hartmannibacter diazotrophicus TaxID=1482074 RepID=A0A2C9DDI6_9HYPH|nr:TadE/TadG family type IV pilus assembly protein [Hartmannibacter diazotrophicus]SON58230.1 Flp pilus assembly protein TadG [Hartmannibacter diazotrophicus]